MEYNTEKERRFVKVYDAFADEVYKVCVYFTEDKVTAQLIAQRAFVDFYERFENIQPEMHRAYLLHVAKKLALEEQKNSKKGI